MTRRTELKLWRRDVGRITLLPQNVSPEVSIS
jgi:hypothetical protein